jgi:hypothetical protein
MARARDGVDQFFRDKDSHGSSSFSADRNPVAGAYTRTQTSDRARVDHPLFKPRAPGTALRFMIKQQGADATRQSTFDVTDGWTAAAPLRWGACSVGRQLYLLAEAVIMGVCHHDGKAACAGGPCLYRQNGVLARPRHATQLPRSGALIRLHG